MRIWTVSSQPCKTKVIKLLNNINHNSNIDIITGINKPGKYAFINLDNYCAIH